MKAVVVQIKIGVQSTSTDRLTAARKPGAFVAGTEPLVTLTPQLITSGIKESDKGIPLLQTFYRHCAVNGK